jgi:ABC-type amino acid transport system permease subunit
MGKIKSPLSFLYNNQIKAFLFQVITLVAVVYFFYNAADNLLSNIESHTCKDNANYGYDNGVY